MKRLKFFLLTCASVFFLSMEKILACPNCKEAFDEGTQQAAIGDTYSMTVLFMLGMPILAICIVSYVIYSNIQKQKAKS